MNELYTEFPPFIYEALITKINPEDATCTISCLSPGLEDQVNNVPLPNHIGAGNSGLFHGLEVGSRVVVANTSGKGSEYSVIIATMPKESLFKKNFRRGKKPRNVPAGAIPYPDMANGKMVIRGGQGNALELHETGESNLLTVR